MRLVVGLGNPGSEYAHQRHNVGFMAVDAIARIHGISTWRKRFAGESAEGSIAGAKVLLLKPLTYMNDSGRAVQDAARFYKIGPEDVIVLHDELDLVPGKVRVKRGGGAAGHNGLRSTDAAIGPDYLRVRIGIGHPGDKSRVTPYVLSNFAKAERPMVDAVDDAIAEAFPLLLKGDEAGFMNRVALKTAPFRAADNGNGNGPNGNGVEDK
ncbi:MAG TPA: aminoacyl-tRNA hydrolase [Alphaproteobacteria bacterium]|nr:aminoacyl-tRNA hydrolase [Alphaproteobacteria bacterium]